MSVHRILGGLLALLGLAVIYLGVRVLVPSLAHAMRYPDVWNGPARMEYVNALCIGGFLALFGLTLLVTALVISGSRRHSGRWSS